MVKNNLKYFVCRLSYKSGSTENNMGKHKELMRTIKIRKLP